MSGIVGFCSIIRFHGFFFEETENVIENKITIWLFCKKKSLNKLAPRFVVIRHFADDLDDNAAIC